MSRIPQLVHFRRMPMRAMPLFFAMLLAVGGPVALSADSGQDVVSGGDSATPSEEESTTRAGDLQDGSMRGVPTGPPPSVRLSNPTADALAAALDAPSVVTLKTLVAPPNSAAVSNSFGGFTPRQGQDLAVLCTGDVSSQFAEPGTDLAGLDEATLTLTIQMPKDLCTDGTPCGVNGQCPFGTQCAVNLHRLNFAWNFLSAEYPEHVGSQARDAFTATLRDITPGSPANPTLLANEPQNTGLTPVARSVAANSPFDLFTIDPANDSTFGPGHYRLPDAGFASGESVPAPLVGGHSYELEFNIKDSIDSLMDSCVTLDRLSVTTIETIDPNPDLLDPAGQILTNPYNIATGGRSVSGAVADGVTQLLLREEVSLQEGTVEFCLAAPAKFPEDGQVFRLGETQGGQCVTATVTTVGSRYFAFAVFQAPEDFNRGGDENVKERPLIFESTWRPEGPPALDGRPQAMPKNLVPSKLARKTLVLIHGIWSGPETWNKFPLWSDPAFDVYLADYKDNPDHSQVGNAAHFATNTPYIFDNVQSALSSKRKGNLAATDVDVVAHSMGGILTRRFVSSGHYRSKVNRQVGSVRRLITLDTPHFGTPAANLLSFSRLVPSLGTELSFAMFLAGKPINFGAVDDLNSCSRALKEMPDTPADLFAHALAGTPVNQPPYAIFYLPVPVWTPIYGPMVVLFGVGEDLFQEPHDLIVPLTSQQGGIDGWARSGPYNSSQGGVHLDNTSSHTYSHKARELLNDVGNARYSFLPSPGDWCDQHPSFTPSIDRDAERSFESTMLTNDLTITSPTAGATVTAGTTIEVAVEAAQNMSIAKVLVVGRNAVATDETSPFAMSFDIPTETLGDFEIVAIGKDEQGDSHQSSPVLLKVVAPTPLVSLRLLTADTSTLTIDERRSLAVQGTFGDAVARDLRQAMSNLSFLSTNSAVVSVNQDGVIKGVGAGTAVVVATFDDPVSGLIGDSILVTCLGESRPTASASAPAAVYLNTLVTLNGAGSSDPNPGPDILHYQWEQLTGPGVTIDGATTASASFTTDQAGVYEFQLTVSDGHLISEPAIVTVSSGVCGNTLVDSKEECDDGNVVACDGCSPTCTTENIQATGACCTADSCVETNETCCTSLTGQFTDGGNCQSMASCYVEGTGCIETTSNCCTGANGSFSSTGDPEDMGACTIGETCSQLSEQCCNAANGTFDTEATCPDDDCSVTAGSEELRALLDDVRVNELFEGNALGTESNFAGAGKMTVHVDANRVLQVLGGAGPDLIVIRLVPGASNLLEIVDGSEPSSSLGVFDVRTLQEVHVDGGEGSDALVFDHSNGIASAATRFQVEGTEVALSSSGVSSARKAFEMVTPTLEGAQALVAAAKALVESAGVVAPLGNSGSNLLSHAFRTVSDSQGLIVPASSVLEGVHDNLVVPVSDAIQNGLNGPIARSTELVLDAYNNAAIPAMCRAGGVGCNGGFPTPEDYFFNKHFVIQELAQAQADAADAFADRARDATSCAESDLGVDPDHPEQGGHKLRANLQILQNELLSFAGDLLYCPPETRANEETTRLPLDCLPSEDIGCCLGHTELTCAARIDLVVTCMEKLVDAFEGVADKCAALSERFAVEEGGEFESDAETDLEKAGANLEQAVDALENAGDGLSTRADLFECSPTDPDSACNFAANTEDTLGDAGAKLEETTRSLGQTGETFASTAQLKTDELTAALVSRADQLNSLATGMISNLAARLAVKLEDARAIAERTPTHGASSYVGTANANFFVVPDGGHWNVAGGRMLGLIIGSPSSETLTGGPGPDFIFGMGGEDTFHGGAGVDLLVGGADRDIMHGDDGLDIIIGLGGADEMHGGNGIDLLVGGAGNNEMHGDAGIDVVIGGPEGNSIFGDKCIDILVGGNQVDHIQGGEGQTVKVGSVEIELGNLIIGREGDDFEYGDTDEDTDTMGIDVMFGGPGIDVMVGGKGGNLSVGEDFVLALGNVMFGGTDGDDMSSRDGIDVMFGGPGNDTMCAGVGALLEFGDNFSLAFGDLLFGGPSDDPEPDDDTMYGDACPDNTTFRPCHPEDFGTEDGDIDLIFGGRGDDEIYAGNGGALSTKNFDLDIGNLVFAGTGNDTVTAGKGIDLLFGWDGDDTMCAGDGAPIVINDFSLDFGDFLFGGEGNDHLYGDALADSNASAVDGIDVLFGGIGGDELYGGNGGDLTLPSLSITFGGFFFGGSDDGGDTLVGGYALDGDEKGIDFMFAGQGMDTLDGQEGGLIKVGGDPPSFEVDFGNLMFGGPDNDDMRSRDGLDVMFGGTGNDTMKAGDGIDLMFGGPGSDYLDGGDGGTFNIPSVSPKPIPFGNIEFGGPDNDTVKSGGKFYEALPDQDPAVPLCLEIDVLFGGCGDDTMQAGDGLLDLVFGNKGRDTMYGEQGIDLLIGGRGDDIIYGSCGPKPTGSDPGTCHTTIPSVDLLFGGKGDDTLYGDCHPEYSECGSDIPGHVGLLFAGEGNDDVHMGDDGTDHGLTTDWLEPLNVAFGGPGRDEITGTGYALVSPSIDVIFGGADCDRIHGHKGVLDVVFGGIDGDVVDDSALLEVVFGGQGNDILDGRGGGLNVMFGGVGQDVVLGGSGLVNILFGNAGADAVEGGGVVDLVFGGPENDSLFGGNLISIQFGGDGSDILYGGNGIDLLFGGLLPDALYGKGGLDLLFGGAGGDMISGGEGIELIMGGSESDTINSGPGSELIFGRDGDDQISGGSDGIELIFGGPGADSLGGEEGDGGSDWIFGGKGNDKLYSTDGDHRFKGAEGGDKLDQSFSVTVTESAFGVIAGTKWGDMEGDSARDARLGGVSIYLDDTPSGGNATLDGCDPNSPTSACGTYVFFGVSTGPHQVREVVPPAFSAQFVVGQQDPSTWPININLSDPIVLNRDFVNRDDCRALDNGLACDPSCPCQNPSPIPGMRCTNDGSECDGTPGECGCDGTCVDQIVDCACPAIEPELHVIAGDVTCDNQFAIFTAASESSGMTVNYRGVTGCHPAAPSVAFSTTDQFLYIAAWSSDTVAQGLLHDLTVDGVPVFSGNPRWTVTPVWFDYDACFTTLPGELAAKMEATIPAGRWATPATGCANPAPGGLCYNAWGNFPTIDLSAHRTWYDSGEQDSTNAPFAPGFNHGEFLIFRLDMNCSCGPDGDACDDGNPCTVNDECNAGVCGGEPKDCSDPEPCTIDACVPATGGCTHTPAATALDVRVARVDDVNGDRDGYPDTNETVDLYVTVTNKSAQDLTNVTMRLSTSDPKIECLAPAVVNIGFLAGHASVTPSNTFRFRISPTANRTSINESYAAAFTILVQGDPCASLSRGLLLELDLNATSPVGDTVTYTEGFEAGMSTFTLMNLDFNVATNAASDGLRCQYSDPNGLNSNAPGNPFCYLGFVDGQSPVNDWHVHGVSSPDGGRAYLGTASLHYGKHTNGDPDLDTYGLSQMDAIRSLNPVNLAARVCATPQSGSVKACNVNADCTSPPSVCISASPELSFKHQISTVDSRSGTTPLGEAADRGIVELQIADPSTGTGIGYWIKIFPYENVYDAQGSDNLSECMFDPADDGTFEDDYYDPTDPLRRLGPSSTCGPEFVFSYIGDTDEPFASGNIGRASDGPGLQGSLGLGTWVQSRFDLTEYRGRRIRLRFLFTSIKVGDTHTVEDQRHWHPKADDDGWYIDDLRVTQTLTTPVTLTLDAAANSGLPPCRGGSGTGPRTVPVDERTRAESLDRRRE